MSQTDISRTTAASLAYRVGCTNRLMISLQWVYIVVTVFPVLCGVTGMSRVCLIFQIVVRCESTMSGM